MKVIASLADSASLKELEFDKKVDTTNQQSAVPTINALIPGPSISGPKKKHAITHFATFPDGRIAFSRKNGEISINNEIIGRISSEAVGLAILDKETIAVFASEGDSLVIKGDKSIHFSLREGLSTVVQNPQRSFEFASAGAEQLPDVFSLEVDDDDSVSVSVTWKATQPPNDILDLPERNLVSGLAFVGSNQLVAVTSHGKIRVYDLSTDDGQPADMVQASKDGIKSISADPSHPDTVIIGDSRSTVSRWAMNPLKLLGHYKGVNGSTRSISVRGSFLATGGLDRYVRVFDVVKRQPAGRVYVGDAIWALALVRTDSEEEQKDVDEFWSKIESEPSQNKEEKSGSESESESEFEAESESESGSESGSESESDDSFEGFDD